ncbi:hypothetical protein BX616_007178 [Lobosporangium transversale]|uniref:Uncharacterized protein n=1 Tax=Lobosporangium transversale TaxID=64571 RepID=A0A1Y2GU05_9FUNG|nr:hypothetical protein BCR41DRAFT_352140 [Lobosporangium transversale]KAF9914969.1 hypothetical protein BX616_007178 [Lobosporangium transversale]ORZ18284.1 hypothetical protein BCR41DRAFT_352140 [Lobosporangium transversale]|eukprot:XP_021882079.1 hypothetical protein BCR41DRAFT_352140 [Lobosporangium transversale]
MRLLSSRGAAKQEASSSHSSSYKPSSASLSRSSSSLTWSVLCSFVILNSFLALLSPSTSGGRALAALEPGFCGDCQTFANAIQVCGGSFTPADIEIVGEYVLQQAYSKCLCTEVMQKVLWTCAKCELLAGHHQAKAPPPQKYQTQCIAWGMTIQEWKQPYTGTVAPGTQTDVTGGGGTNPNPNPEPQPTQPNQPSATGPSNQPKPSNGSGSNPGNGNGDGNNSTSPPNANESNSSADNSVSGNKPAEQTSTGSNGLTIGIAGGIIGIAVVAGTIAVVMMKRRRRRRSPLDLDSLPGQTGQFAPMEDKWENSVHHPSSPPLPPAPIASATPVAGHARGGYDNAGYMDGNGSAVGGYDPQYDGYNQYDNYDQYNGHHGGYGGQYGGQYMDQGHYGQGQYDQDYHQGHPGQDGYSVRDYGGYENKSQVGGRDNSHYM